MNATPCLVSAAALVALVPFAWAQSPGTDAGLPEVRVKVDASGRETAAASGERPFDAYPRYYRDTNDLLVRRAEDGTPRNPNPNGSNAGTTPGLAKNNYILKTYAIRNANAVDVQSYLLRSLVYEGGIAEVMGRQDLKDADGNLLQFVFVTAPDFMIPGIDETIARIDVQGFTFHDGTGNSNSQGQAGCTSYVGKHRTAGELKAILIGTELGNIGQFYYAPFADPALNTIYISDNPVDIADDLAALEMFDRPPLQAEFEVTIFEIDDDTLEDVGVDFDAFKRSLSGTITLHEINHDGESLSIDALVNLDAALLSDFLDFLVQRGKAEIHTETKILSINSEDNPGSLSDGAKGGSTATPAEFRSVRFLPHGALVPLGAPAGEAHLVSAVDPSLFEGIELTIQPFIAAASITADVRVTVNSLIGLGRDEHVPNIVSRSSRSVVNLLPGVKCLLGSYTKQTQVETQSGIPLLMDIPFLGRLFRRDVTVDRTSQLLVFALPRIIGGDGVAQPPALEASSARTR